MDLLKRFFFLAIALHITLAVKPPNYIEKPKIPDKYPPKYEYNYFVANRHTQSAQGHKEIRNGDNTRGNYFVNLPKGESKATVNYIADEWGYHPVSRYLYRGPHHRVSGHFALGQHAVEQLNETNLNTNEVFFNQYPGYQASPPQHQQQQIAQATFPAAQVAFNPKTPIQVPLIDNKPPLSNIYATNQAHQDYQQQIAYPSPGALYNQPSYRHHEKHQAPLIFQHAQQMPLIYQYAQQQQPQSNYYYQQHKPQEVIYHQQPIASMAEFQQQQQQQHQQLYVVDESQQVLPSPQPAEVVESNSGNINVDVPQVTIPQAIEINSREEIAAPQSADGVNGNLLQVQPEAPNNVATDNQKLAKLEKDIEAQSQEVHFQSPIVVGEQQKQQQISDENATIVVQPNQGPVVFQSYQPQQKQFNIQILTDVNAAISQEDQYLREVSATPKVFNGHTNSNNFQYLVQDDQDFKDSTPTSHTEAPSRQFLKKFKNFRTYEHSTTSQSFSTSTSRTVTKSVSEGGCCKGNTNTNCCKSDDKNELKVLSITQRPVPNNFLAPVHAGIRLTNEKLDDCIDGRGVKPVVEPVVEVQKNVNVVVQEQTERIPVYGDRIIVTTPETRIVTHQIYIERPQETKIVHQPIIVEKSVIKEVKVPIEKTVFIKTPPKFIDRPVYIKSPPETKIVEKIVHQPVEVEKVVEKFIDRPYYIKSPPETKVVQQQVFIEKPVIKEVQVPVEKTVYVKSPPETKIVHQPVYQTVEKIVEKPIIQTVEKPVYIEKIVKQPYPVDRIVDRPVIQTVEKPVYIEKFIDRPYEKIVEKPVYQTVEKIVDRPVYQTIEKIVEKPVIQTVETPVYIEKIVDRPVEKFIDRPYPVPYAVAVPYEKHVYHKPDFHVVAKSNQHKHKLFDFGGLLDFLGKKKEIKHIYVPSSQQHQLKQLNHHQLIASTYTTIDPVQEAPVLDYSRYATTHLNPIKPVYGVPSTPLAPVHTGYSYQNPYAGTYDYNHQNPGGVATIPSSWLTDSLESQSQISSSVHRDNYVGPTPLSDDYWAINGVSTKEGIKFRRNVENGRSLRIEYGGFMPKMSPSIEIDANGTPLKKEEN